LTIRGGGVPPYPLACMPDKEWVRCPGASPPKRMTASWSGSPDGSNRIQGRGAMFAPPGGLPSEGQASRFRKAKKTPRRDGMSGPMNGPDRTMMRDGMRQEGSPHPGRREPHQGRSDVAARLYAPRHGSLRTFLTTSAAGAPVEKVK